MKFLKFVFILPFVGSLAAQSVDKRACRENFYKGDLVSAYSVYKVGSTVKFDSLSITKTDAANILKAFGQQEVVSAIQKIKTNPIFTGLVEEYAGTSEQESQNLHDHARNFKGQKDYVDLTKNLEILNRVAATLLTGDNSLLHVSLYSNMGDYGDCYFYELGYDGFEYKILAASVIESVLYEKDQRELAAYKNDAIGVTTRQNGQVVALPLVVKGKYICDIRLMLCRK